MVRAFCLREPFIGCAFPRALNYDRNPSFLIPPSPFFSCPRFLLLRPFVHDSLSPSSLSPRLFPSLLRLGKLSFLAHLFLRFRLDLPRTLIPSNIQLLFGDFPNFLIRVGFHAVLPLSFRDRVFFWTYSRFLRVELSLVSFVPRLHLAPRRGRFVLPTISGFSPRHFSLFIPPVRA